MRLNKFLFLALFALVCFASQLRADVPPIIWYKTFGGNISGLSLHPNGNYLLLGDQANIVSAEDGHVVKTYTHPSNTYSKFSSSGKYVGLGGWRDDHQNGQITLFDFATDSIIFQKYFEGSPVGGFDISPDESKLVIVRKGWMEFWDLETQTKTDSIKFYDYQGSPKSIENISYSPDGKYIAYTIENSGTIELIDANTHQKRFSTASPKWYGRLRFSPNSKLLAFNSSLDSTAIEIINLDSMKVLDKVAGFIQSTADIIFTKDSKNILFTGLGSLNYLKKYYLASKTLTTIMDYGWGGFIQLSNDDKYIYDGLGSQLGKADISSYLSVEEYHNIPQLNLSLNPSQDSLNLSFTTTVGREFIIRIVNIEGQVVKTLSGYSSGDTFSGAYDISDLASGNYILSVQGSGINSSANFSIAR